MNSEKITPKVKEAFAFCVAAHEAGPVENRVRKYDGNRYWSHPLEVMYILLKLDNVSENQLIAALLHDVLEDVYVDDMDAGYTIIDLLFHTIVADMVVDLTDVYTTKDYPNKNRKERKTLEIARFAKFSNEVKTIKLADFKHNSESIINSKDNFAKIYMKEKSEALVALQGGDKVLHMDCVNIVNEFFKE